MGVDWEGHREHYVEGDFLLPYKLDDTEKTGCIVFLRVRAHADLFK
ncbi:MAG: hypothetical protein WCH96_04460 [Betaproteobacteria bacterium]